MAESSTSGIWLVNGRQSAVLPTADRGLAYGDGLFETIRFRGALPPAWPLHWGRLSRGAQVLGLPDPAVLKVREQLDAALALAQQKGIPDGILKLMVTRGCGGSGYLPPAEPRPNVLVHLRPFRPFASAARLETCRYRLSHNPALAGLKHLNRLEHVLAAQSVSLDSSEQGLVLDVDGRLVETLHHNLFLARQGRLLTPDLSRCGVAGVLRHAILETFAADLGVDCVVDDLTPADLQAADEVFICNGVHGITPVHGWQTTAWKTGPITQRLIQHISGQWKRFYDR